MDTHAGPLLIRVLAAASPAQDPEPAYSMAPSQNAWVILMRDGQTVAERLRWGLVPAWAKDANIGYRTINARLEAAATKPAFRAVRLTELRP